MKPDRGTVALVGLDPTRGHEQRGTRPCVIVSDAEIIANQRFTLVVVVPISTTSGEGALYPPLSPGPSGLRKASFALVDQIRAVDKRRIQRVFGSVSNSEIAAIDEGLALFLGPGQQG
ncbi:MAG: type II toxin-antitoxin system PemK/MazF family toxin [Acidobacteriota bacterium]